MLNKLKKFFTGTTPEQKAGAITPVTNILPPESTNLAGGHKKQGDQYLGEGNLSAAEQCYRQAIAIDNTLVKAYGNLGFVLKEQGRNDEAEALLRQAIALDPDIADAHYFLGGIYQAQGKPDLAQASFQKAVTLTPDFEVAYRDWFFLLLQNGQREAARQVLIGGIASNPGSLDLHYFLGNLYYEENQFALAAKNFQQASAIQPENAELLTHLGNAFHKQGKFSDAIASFNQAVAINPQNIEAYDNLANSHLAKNQLNGAIVNWRKMLEIDPGLAHIHNNLGVALFEKNLFDDAAANCRAALKIKPDFAEAHFNLGNALHKSGQLALSIESYRNSLRYHPHFADALNNLAIVLKDNGKLEEAVNSCRQALAINPKLASAHNTLGSALHALGKLTEAVASCRRALELMPDMAEAHNNLGMILSDCGEFDEAETSHKQALKLAPEMTSASFNFGLLLLTQGRYAEAWPYHEYRHDPRTLQSNTKIPKLPFPQWQGESLAGKSLVIWPEQGFGDYIQFIRYAALLKERGLTRFTVFCAPALKALLATAKGVDAVITDLASLPAHDYWCLALSLPLHFNTTVATIPVSIPYLHALSERVAQWQIRMPANRLKIGLVWKGSEGHANDRNRSLPGLTSLAALWQAADAGFISLQKGQGETEALNAPANQPITPLGADIRDFADTAAIVAQLDLVICVDTAIAHIAGALGKPCWVLLPKINSDWRWMRERDDTPWYPQTTRLFRQKEHGDWNKLVAEVAAELKVWTAKVG
ncbi:tetratricopeptide repeat protein [Undibacterium sp. TJN19]|uniref:tetratricopeptide repeat protein n=1 Tax=Undibacterium sp. TJN19 TaxID=3413055 RepID=UPI003BEFB613